MMEGEGEEEGGREGEGVMSFFDVRFCVGWDLFFFFFQWNGEDIYPVGSDGSDGGGMDIQIQTDAVSVLRARDFTFVSMAQSGV